MTPSGVGSPTTVSAALGLVGKVLSERYRIEALVGEGGMGAVYLAEHVLMRKRLAVKVLHPAMTRMPEIVARFEREAMAAAHIEHPNVAAATDFGKLDDGAFFLVLEYVEGTSLRDLVASGPLGVERALHITYQIASALSRAHGLGIVHRDLKPENVMLVQRDGDPDFVKVLDFGIAKVPVGEFSHHPNGTQSGQVLTQLGMVYGTPEYMAPEQALGQEVDARADLYALGVLLFEMLTGVRPFEADSKVALLGMKITSDPPSLVSKNPSVQVGDTVEALVRKLLDKEASCRFQEARDVLESIESSRLVEAKTEPPIGRGHPTPPNVPASARYRASLASVPRAPAPSADAVWAWSGKSGRAKAWVSGIWHKARTVTAAIPPLVLSASLGLVLLIAIILGIAARWGPNESRLPSGSASAALPDPPFLKRLLPSPLAPADALAAATASGTAAVEDLSARYPEDPAAWRALVRAYTKEKRGADAMRAVSKWVALNPRASDDPEVEDAVNAAVAGSTESTDAAFALLEDGLGAKGPDLLYALSTGKGIAPRTLARVKQMLAKAEVKTRMSPALAVALELRSASGCEAKRSLLARAKEQGDGRALPSLRNLQTPKGCGFLGLGDCWSCLRRDNSLNAAIAAIEDRADK